MGHAASLPRQNRIAALAVVIVAHLMLIAALLLTRSAEWSRPVVAGALTVISLPAEPSAAPPPPPSMPSKIVDEVVATPIAVSTQPSEGTSAATAAGCTTLDAITRSILADRAAVSAVLQAPPETRSIAEAIVVWNAGWHAATASIEAPLAPVRTAVMSSLADVEESCLDELIAGPRLVPIPAGERTMFLAFGSGNWTWRELLIDAETLPAVPVAAEPRAGQAARSSHNGIAGTKLRKAG